MLAIVLLFSTPSTSNLRNVCPAQTTIHHITDLFVDLFFICDIIINFRTAYYDEASKLVIDREKIWKQYTSTWFVPDVISSIPVQIIHFIDQSASNLMALKMVRLIGVDLGSAKHFSRNESETCKIARWLPHTLMSPLATVDRFDC